MGVLRVDHPDIREFISCKMNQKVLNGFNISVGMTDDFMSALCDNKAWFDLISPRTSQVVAQVNPEELMNEIVANAYHNGEPGVLFLDTINKRNPLPHIYKIEATNPCVTEDHLIMTSTGAKYVRDLIGMDFCTHEGSRCPKGFFFRGSVATLTIRTKGQRWLRCSANHRIMIHNGRWAEAAKLLIGDKLVAYGQAEFDEVSSITETKGANGRPIHENVYDCTVNSSFHCYVSNGLLSHNCGNFL